MLRWLEPSDEHAFKNLVLAIYGSTYSYAALYKKNGFRDLIQSGYLKSLGEFEENGALIGHTGFWCKDKENNYLESGLSLRVASRNKRLSASELINMWQWLFNHFRQKYYFIHQQTTTYHSFAQKHAKKYMHAVPCGIIFNYAMHERLNGISHASHPMHSLMMTSVLNNKHQQSLSTIYLPEQLATWVNTIYTELNLSRNISIISMADLHYSRDIDYKIIETNTALNLQRRFIKFTDRYLDERIMLKNSSYRTDLIHLPLTNNELVSTVFPLLLSSDYVPIGIRPHALRSDELVFQRLAQKDNIIDKLLHQTKFSDENTHRLMDLWRTSIQQIF